MENLYKETVSFLKTKSDECIRNYKETNDPEKKSQAYKELKNIRNRISYEIKLINKMLEDEEND